jgi:hypothetical protein
MPIIFAMLFLWQLTFADDFARIISSPTPQMLHNIQHAKVCKNPAPAKENFDKDFKYGCFCGKDYPGLISHTGKSYRKLDRDEREKLIARYYKTKPIDTIDALCLKHDICYISTGRADPICDDILFDELKKVSSYFFEQAKQKQHKAKAMRCERLSYDIARVFKTLSTTRENLSMTRMGIFMMFNTPITVMSKGIQSTAHGFNTQTKYPLPHERCIVK